MSVYSTLNTDTGTYICTQAHHCLFKYTSLDPSATSMAVISRYALDWPDRLYTKKENVGGTSDNDKTL